MRRSLVVGLLALGGAAQCAQVSYQRLEFGGMAEHGIFAEDLDGDGSPEIIALGRGRISVYRCRPGAPQQYPDLPELLHTGSMAYFADVADVLPAKGRELVVLTPSGVACFVHKEGRYNPRPQMLIKCETVLTSRALRGAVALAAKRFTIKVLPWNFAFDADGDGRDDVFVYQGNGVDLYLQGKQAGRFPEKPITLPIFPFIIHEDQRDPGPGYLGGHRTGRVSLILDLLSVERHDVNRDQKPDLVLGRYWFAQKHAGGFDTTASEALPENLPERPGRNPFDIRADLNADRRIDRIYAENKLDDPLNIVTRVRYFLADGRGVLPDKPSGVIVDQNILIQNPLPLHDFNGDGLLDFAMFNTDITVTMVAKWVRQSFGKIDGDLNFWFFEKAANAYPRSRSYRKSIRMRFKVDLMVAMAGQFWERYLSTMMRFEGDYNGDGRVDLLVREHTHTIALYFNTGERRDLFPSRPSITLDKTPPFGGLDVHDLNADGASDLILYRITPTLASEGDPSPNDVIAAYISKRQ